MDDNVIEITINGVTYWIEANRLNDLHYIDNKLVNVSNSTITLVHSYDTVNTYPRITCSAMQQCRYYATNNTNYVGVSSNYSYEGKFNINTLQTSGLLSSILFGIIIILGVKLIWKR